MSKQEGVKILRGKQHTIAIVSGDDLKVVVGGVTGSSSSTRPSAWQRLSSMFGVNIAVSTGNNTRVSVNNTGAVNQEDTVLKI